MRFIRPHLAIAALLCLAAAPLDGTYRRLQHGASRPASAPTGPVLVYYGASWCGPCTAFVPELVRVYPTLRQRGLEVVFVADESCGSGTDYARRVRMPWLLLPCDPVRNAGLRRLGGKALPGLILFDRDGQLILSSWHKDGNSTPRAMLTRITSR